MKTWRHWLVGVLAALCVGSALAQAGPEPRVDGVDVEQVPALAAGTTLRFTVFGTPGADAWLHIDGAQRSLSLAEVEGGIYEGTYVIDGADRIEPGARVTADLRQGDRVASALLDEPLVLGTVAELRCHPCGVVHSVQAVEVPVEPGYAGALAGGVVGAIIGNQVGRGDHRTLARILGALGGAYVGRELERANRTQTQYDVLLRLDDGSLQRRRYSAAPPLRAGDRVRIVQDRWLRESPADQRQAAF